MCDNVYSHLLIYSLIYNINLFAKNALFTQIYSLHSLSEGSRQNVLRQVVPRQNVRRRNGCAKPAASKCRHVPGRLFNEFCLRLV
jgi:hypothetical protein